MIGSQNLLNVNIGTQNPSLNSASKKSVNKYYNIFSKKMEELELPNIDLEYNTVILETSSFMRTA